MIKKKWKLKEQNTEQAQRIADECNVSKILASLVASRVDSVESAKLYLHGNRNDLYDPYELKDMRKAVDRIKQAVDSQENIAIFGDYDVDGITSLALLIRFLRKMNIDPFYLIPSRIDEGYGLNSNDLQKCFDKEISLIITVDCGISDREEIEKAAKQNVDVIVIDHHTPPEILPDAVAIVNAKQTECSYPFTELAAAGAVFKVICALCDTFSLPVEDEYFILACLGTVADIVPLIDENRIIVKEGLEAVKRHNIVGLEMMMKQSRIEKLSSGKISFIIAPRINAAGRIANPETAVQLLITQDKQKARELAASLSDINRQRQETEAGIFDTAVSLIKKRRAYYDSREVIVLSSPHWHVGVIGIVTSKLKEMFHKPAILISETEDECRGSGRSIEGFNLFNAVEHCSDILEKFGGHEMAVGFSVKKDNVQAFDDKINEYASQIFNEQKNERSFKIDMKIDIDIITDELTHEIFKIKPYGCKNPLPIFLSEKVTIPYSKQVGPKQNHLKLKIKGKRKTFDAIGFDLVNTTDCEIYSPAQLFDIIYDIDINTWRNLNTVQLKIKDIRYNQSEDEQNFLGGFNES